MKLVIGGFILCLFFSCAEEDYTCSCVTNGTSTKEIVKAYGEASAKTKCKNLSTSSKTCALETKSSSSSHHDDDLFDD